MSSDLLMFACFLKARCCKLGVPQRRTLRYITCPLPRVAEARHLPGSQHELLSPWELGLALDGVEGHGQGFEPVIGLEDTTDGFQLSSRDVKVVCQVSFPIWSSMKA